jgi:hypothetical protein
MTRRRLAAGICVVIVLAAAGLAFFLYQSQRDSPQTQKAAQMEGDVISVYFPGEVGKLQRKVVEVHKQPSDLARAETLFRELKEARCIPDRLKIYEMALGGDGVLYLDISAEFIDRNTPDKEITMTYGIVNSFIESFHNVKRVQILVEGQPVYTRSGLLYLFSPLEFNKELVED